MHAFIPVAGNFEILSCPPKAPSSDTSFIPNVPYFNSSFEILRWPSLKNLELGDTDSCSINPKLGKNYALNDNKSIKNLLIKPLSKSLLKSFTSPHFLKVRPSELIFLKKMN